MFGDVDIFIAYRMDYDGMTLLFCSCSVTFTGEILTPNEPNATTFRMPWFLYLTP